MSLQSVFEELIDLSPEQRAERLRGLSLTDGERARLQSMLEVATERLPLLDMPVDEVIGQFRPDEAAFTRLVGRMVGPFRVLELIGEGGSAAVFRASRPAGSGEQLVALKVLRASMFSADGERRFRREQAILAQLTHPNVAR
jgi:serine/threonine-protein kinase